MVHLRCWWSEMLGGKPGISEWYTLDTNYEFKNYNDKKFDMTEKQMALKFKKIWLKKHPGGFYYRIQDTYSVSEDDRKFSSKRPFDAFAIYDSKVYVFEFKYQRAGRVFNVQRHLPEHQKTSLRLAKNNGAIAKLIIGQGEGKSLEFHEFDLWALSAKKIALAKPIFTKIKKTNKEKQLNLF